MATDWERINTGVADDDGTGDSLRDAGGKTNRNFEKIFDDPDSLVGKKEEVDAAVAASAANVEKSRLWAESDAQPDAAYPGSKSSKAWAATSKAAADGAAAVVSSIVFTPLGLFGANDRGAFFDVSRLSTLFSDRAGTTAAVLNGPVGRILDLSGKANHWTAASDAARPTLVQDENGFYALKFDGVDDFGVTGDYATTDAGRISVFAAASTSLTNSGGNIAGVYSEAVIGNRAIELQVNNSFGRVNGHDSSNATIGVTDDDTDWIVEGQPFVLGGVCDGTYVNTWRNGWARRGVKYPFGPKVPGNTGFSVGGTANVRFFSGLVYGAVAISRALSGREVADLTAFLAARCGVPAIQSDKVPFFAADGCNQPWIGGGVTCPPAVYDQTHQRTYITWTAFDQRLQAHMFRVRAFDHVKKRWGKPFTIGKSQLMNDDHDPAAICRDPATGFLHAFGGPHAAQMQHFRSVKPDDPSQWVELAMSPVGYKLTYPHPVFLAGKLQMFSRHTIEGTSMPFTVFDVETDGTWSNFREIVEFGSGTRSYGNRAVPLDGERVMLALTRADYGDTTRKGVFVVIYNASTGQASNLAGTRILEAGDLPISLAEARQNFQLVADDENTQVVGFDYAVDPANPARVHLAFVNNLKWTYRQYLNGVQVGSDQTIANASGTRDVGSVYCDEQGRTNLLYIEEVAGVPRPPEAQHPPICGNIHKLTRGANGEWGADEMVQRYRNYGLSIPFGLSPGSPDIRAIWTESCPAGNGDFGERGNLRMFAFGDNGFAESDVEGATEVVLGLNAPLLPSFPIGGVIGPVESYQPHGRPIVRMQKIIRGSAFSLVDGLLIKKAAFTGHQRVVIRSTDQLGRKSDNAFIVRQVEDASGYAFVNAEVATWYGRLGIYLSNAQKAAYDTFATSLKNAGVWQLLDVLVPPRVPQMAAALLNMRQAKFDGVLNHATTPVRWSNENGFRVDGTGRVRTGAQGEASNNGAGATVDTSFNPATAGGNFSQNSASLGVWINDYYTLYDAGGFATNNTGQLGGTPANTVTLALFVDGNTRFAINQAAPGVAGVIGSKAPADIVRHLFAANRSGSTSTQSYQDGAPMEIGLRPNEPSVALANSNLQFGWSTSTTGRGWSPITWDGYFIGGSLTAAQHLALSQAWIALKAAMAAAAA